MQIGDPRRLSGDVALGLAVHADHELADIAAEFDGRQLKANRGCLAVAAEQSIADRSGALKSLQGLGRDALFRTGGTAPAPAARRGLYIRLQILLKEAVHQTVRAKKATKSGEGGVRWAGYSAAHIRTSALANPLNGIERDIAAWRSPRRAPAPLNGTADQWLAALQIVLKKSGDLC